MRYKTVKLLVKGSDLKQIDVSPANKDDWLYELRIRISANKDYALLRIEDPEV